MARRRRHRPLTTPKSLVPTSEPTIQSSKPLVQPSEMPEQSSQPPSQPELRPIPINSSASQPRSAEQQYLELQPLHESGATKNRMRTRASTRSLELLTREDEKSQPQALEPQSPMAIHSAPLPHPPKRRSSEAQHLNSSGSTMKRVRTRASVQSSELSTKQEQQLRPQPVELLSPILVQSDPQPPSPEPQHLDASREDEQLKPQLVEKQSSQPPTQSQPHCVKPQSQTTIHTAPQAGSPEQKPLGPQLSDAYGPTKKLKRSRGPTRCIELVAREDVQPLSVAANEFGQPIGPNARKLTSFLGTITRDPKKAPLLWHDWRAMPQKYKDNMWENVKEKFQVGDSLKDWVMMSLATKWRNFKAYVKKKHYDDKAGKDRLIINDKRVDPEHWKELVRFWDSAKGQLRSSTNRANRAKLHGVHTAGSKSFAMLREEMRIKSPDLQNPSQTEVYMLTHTLKDGRPIDEASATVMTKLSEQVSEQEASECDTPMDAILAQILGEDKHGRVRTFGLGPSPSDLYGTKPTRAQVLQMVNEIKRTSEEKLTKMREQMEAMKAEQEGMKADQEEMKQKYEGRLTELQTQLQAVLLLVQGNNVNFQFSPQQHLISPSSTPLLQPPLATSTVGMGSGFPNILRKRKVIGDVPVP